MFSKVRYFISLLLLLLILVVLFAEPFAPFREKFRPKPTVVYERLPAYSERDRPFYQPLSPSPFTEINIFKEVVAWSYNYDIPLLLSDNIILIAGYIDDGKRSHEGRTSFDLFSVDIRTGEVYWQTVVGGHRLATDGKYIFVEATGETFVPATVIAYDLHSGDMIWKTTLDFKYAGHVDYLTVAPSGLVVETVNKGFQAVYILDLKSGEAKERHPRHLVSKTPMYNNLVFSKGTQERMGPVIATRKSDGLVVWTYDQPVVSNIAVGGLITYFFTKDSQLVAVDTETGDVLGSLNFTPIFPDNFRFEHDIIVAAEQNIVSVYFGDKQQLSIFRFEQN